MAFSSGNKKGPVSEINVTPLVDVMLVLLVIFMVTAPMMFSGVNLKLPKTGKVTNLNLRPEMVVLSVSAGQILLNGNLVSAEDLFSFVAETVKQNPEAQAIVSADGNSKHSDFVRVIDQIKSAGLEKFAIQVEKIKEGN